MRRWILLGAVLGICLTLSTAWADNTNPPPWAGEDKTTFQMWEFGDSSTTPPPDAVSNPYGDPILTVTGGMPKTYWIADYEGHSGVWRYEDWILVGIDNFEEPDLEKWLWVQMTYYGENGGAFFSTLPAESSVETIEKLDLGDGWFHSTHKIVIPGNPDYEEIYIQPEECTTYLDELVIHTICIPEPATICLFGLGALALLRKRRA